MDSISSSSSSSSFFGHLLSVFTREEQTPSTTEQWALFSLMLQMLRVESSRVERYRSMASSHIERIRNIRTRKESDELVLYCAYSTSDALLALGGCNNNDRRRVDPVTSFHLRSHRNSRQPNKEKRGEGKRHRSHTASSTLITKGQQKAFELIYFDLWHLLASSSSFLILKNCADKIRSTTTHEDDNTMVGVTSSSRFHCAARTMASGGSFKRQQ